MKTERLSRQDAMFIYAETPTTPQHGGGLMILESPASYDEVLKDVGATFGRIPRMHQKVARVPGRLHRPVWVDDASFDLRNHVHRVSLPAPGGKEQLFELAADLTQRPLNHDRPLWEAWVVEGLADGRGAVVQKVHHCMIDGIGGVQLMRRAGLLEASHDEPEPEWHPIPAQRRPELVAQALADRRAEVTKLIRGLPNWRPDPRQALRTFQAMVRSGRDRGPDLPLNRAHGPRRRVLAVQSNFDDYRAIRSAFGCTINDVALAVVAGGLREWLIGRGMTGVEQVRASVPVNARTPEELEKMGNHTGNMFVRLPVSEADSVKRLLRVSEESRIAKQSGEAMRTERLQQLAPAALLATLLQWPARNHIFNVIVSNVPGPPEPMYLAGRRVVEIVPIAPLNPYQALGVVVISGDGRIVTSMVVDPDLMPDADRLVDGVERTLHDLLEAAAREGR